MLGVPPEFLGLGYRQLPSLPIGRWSSHPLPACIIQASLRQVIIATSERRLARAGAQRQSWHIFFRQLKKKHTPS